MHCPTVPYDEPTGIALLKLLPLVGGVQVWTLRRGGKGVVRGVVLDGFSLVQCSD